MSIPLRVCILCDIVLDQINCCEMVFGKEFVVVMCRVCSKFVSVREVGVTQNDLSRGLVVVGTCMVTRSERTKSNSKP